MLQSGIDESLFRQWNSGSEKAYRDAWIILYEKCYPVAVRFLNQFVDKSLAGQLAADAFHAALEEIDLMVSGGRFTTEPLVREGRVVEGKVKGLLTNRELSKRDPVEWRCEQKFLALFRRSLILRCLDALRWWHPAIAVLALIQIGVEEEVEEGVVSEETLPADVPPLDKWLLDKEGILLFVRILARASEQLERYPACRETIEGTILYIKCKVAMCSERYQDLCLEELPLEEIQSKTIEELLNGADLSLFDANGTEWRRFLLWALFDFQESDSEKEKRDKRNRLDKRIERCLKVLKPIFNLLRQERVRTS